MYIEKKEEKRKKKTKVRKKEEKQEEEKQEEEEEEDVKKKMMKATMTKTIKTMKETTAMPMKTTAAQTCKHLLIQGAQRMQFFWILTHDGLFFLLIQRYTCFQNIYAPEGNSIELFGSLN